MLPLSLETVDEYVSGKENFLVRLSHGIAPGMRKEDRNVGRSHALRYTSVLVVKEENRKQLIAMIGNKRGCLRL